MITIDSVDTGERRQFQHYTARHVKAKTTVEPGPGASTPASVEQTDGWYLDLPGFASQPVGSPGYVSAAATEQIDYRSNGSVKPRAATQ